MIFFYFMKMTKLAVVLSLFFFEILFSQQDSMTVKNPDSIFAKTQDSLFAGSEEVDSSNHTDAKRKNDIWAHFKYDIVAMAGGFGNAFSRPFHWNKSDYTRVGATVLGVGILYLADDETSRFFMKSNKDVPKTLTKFGSYFGSPQINYGITGAVYVTGLITNSEKLRRTGVLMITAASTTGALQQIMKSAAGRARPGAGLGKNHFKPFGGDFMYRSFPSGHTVLAVTTTYALSKQFKNPWIKAGILTTGAIVPISRVLEGAHWFTDVVLSSAISIAAVEGIDKFLKRKEKYEEDKKYNQELKFKNKISWDLNVNTMGISFVGRF